MTRARRLSPGQRQAGYICTPTQASALAFVRGRDLCSNLGFLSSCAPLWGDHPAPLNPDLLHLGTSNPSGLRQKEHVLADLGPGIWQLSETQLSSATLPAACKTLRSLGRAQHRDIRVHTGAAVPARTNSTWAGSWSGVLTASATTCHDFSGPDPTRLHLSFARSCVHASRGCCAG